jgi:fatty acid desaturase
MTAATVAARREKPRYLFAFSYWDAIPVLMGIGHLAFQIAFIFTFPYMSWPVAIACGLFYSYLIGWNIDSVSHNFTHNPYFKSWILNRAFSLIESLAIGFSQQMYKTVHWRHHLGNSDRPNEKGETYDWYSIYTHGKDGKPENVWRYAFLGVFRGDDAKIFAEMGRNNRTNDVYWAKFESVAFVSWWVLGFIINWQFMLLFLPCWYLGLVISNLVGYYEHLHANPDEPVAWGVSTYAKLYNLFWLNNGYHAEHHYRPRTHWRDMPALRERILDKQKEKGTHVISMAHYLGFLQPDRDSYALGGSPDPEHREPDRHEVRGTGDRQSELRI